MGRSSDAASPGSPGRSTLPFILKLVGGVVYPAAIFGVLLLVPTGTLDWPRAWVFLGVVVLASAITMFGIFRTRPDLLDERYKPPLQRGQPLADRILVTALLLSFVALVAFIPLDVFRFRMLGGPGPGLATFGLLMFVAGWTVIALTLRENAFAAPVVKHQVERGQFVVQTGVYRVVRHPMYAGAILLMAGMPLWLGSYAGALLALVPIAILVLRVRIEERFLREELPGYSDYVRKVRWRVIPLVW